MSKKPSRFGPALSDAQKAAILDQISELLPVCINVQDVAKGQFEYVSAAWEDLTGLPVDRWLGDPMAWLEIIHPDDRDYTLELANSGGARSQKARDVRILHQDGTVHWIHGWTVPVFDTLGEVRRILGLCYDITERKALEEELRQARVEAEQALRARDLQVHRLELDLSRALAELGRTQEEMAAGRAAHESLTPREKDVFQRVVRGDPNKSIAAALHIALATVKVHRSRIMAKFEVENIAQLVAAAIRGGLAAQDET